MTTISAPRSRGAVRARRATAPLRRRRRPSPATRRAASNPQGPVDGYVANRTLSGTKTNTPINETPQSLSVIGAEQIRDQKPQSFDEILRYTPGVAANCSAPTRATTGS